MCGLAGIFKFSTEINTVEAIRNMTNAIAHRGPDSEGYFEDGIVALGHRRLSIIDLSAASNQPVFSEGRTHCIVFNGEIYNYRELKKGLSHYNFTSNGDAEVVLAAFLHWGEIALQKLVGMFAFAIYDINNNSLFIARDRIGVKPVYYAQSNTVFSFASELRAIKASKLHTLSLHHTAIKSYLYMQSFSEPHTIFNEIKQLPAANYMTISSAGIEIKQYWDITAPQQRYEYKSLETTQQKVKELLQQSIERRLVSDVPVAAFLSGGIDSSAVVALMSQVSKAPQTFNIAFTEKEYDESSYAEIIANKYNTQHHKILLKPSDFLDSLPEALSAMDIPSGDGVNSYIVSKQIAQNGIKVAMTGAGGDELFAGYPSFKQWTSLQSKSWFWNIPHALRSPIIYLPTQNRQLGRKLRLMAAQQLDIHQFYKISREIWSPAQIQMLTASNEKMHFELMDSAAMHRIKQFPLLSQVSIMDLLNYTKNTLLKDTDQFSMAVTLEVREPFFDHELIEYCLQIPDEFKYPSYPKQLLVESLGDMLPHEIVHRTKKGFTFPWQHWLRNELKNFATEQINRFAARGFISSSVLQKKWVNFLENKHNEWQAIWQIVVLEHWLHQHMD
jgi:asparagine synthase (glutamine-hydrolysing)